ncbi:MAG TPA: hypothetical protein VFN30_14520 [Chitinophagaceae bacterium]|nr:hypothetical protein [Chitinophagaceae bacterium]
MNKSITPDIREVIGAVSYLPSVSLIMPFEPKMNLKTELAYKLKIATDKIEQQLMNNYEVEKANLILEKLKNLISQLSYTTYKKSVAIFVSPLIEKVYYLDIPVEEKIIIDESFEIRDLVYSKKDLHKYLVLILSAEWTKIFLGNTSQFIRLKTATPDNVNAIWNDIPSKTANFSDPSYRKEVMLNKFLKYSDDGLGIILNATPFPVFVMGTARVIGHFKKITANKRHVVEYIPGNYEEATETEIRKVLAPYIADWRKVMQNNILRQLDAAMNAGKLVSGIDAIWKKTVQKNARLLVVEKNFIYPAQRVSDTEISLHDPNDINQLFIKDAVDDIIERVLVNGGDVEFVDEGLLKDYQKIALIQFY